MPSSSVQARPDAPPNPSRIEHAVRDFEAAPPLDRDLAADIVARMLATADEVRSEMATDRVGWLSLFLADAHLLGEVIARCGCSHEDQVEIAGRLWMVAR